MRVLTFVSPRLLTTVGVDGTTGKVDFLQSIVQAWASDDLRAICSQLSLLKLIYLT